MVIKMLSKSKYLTGLQCLKLLWLQVHEPQRIPPIDITTQYRFDQGHLVGEMAKKYFPSGIDVPTDDFMDNVRQAQQLMLQRRPLFEAGILVENLYSRIDILNPVDIDQWDIIEVKSTTSVKDVHIQDVSFQKHCCNLQGINIRNSYIMHINNNYIKDGEINPEEYFSLQDISTEVYEAIAGIQDRIDEIYDAISRPYCPEIIIGKQCSDPYDCKLGECWDFLPEGNVFNLYRGGRKCFELFDDGILAIGDIPEDYKLTESQQIQRNCECNVQPYINKQEIIQFLSKLEYPLYYLDFETIGPAVPMFDGTRPYQAVPFQFSLHIVKDEYSKPEHFSFLAEGKNDPRPDFLAELNNVLGDNGSIIVYNQSFEEGILKNLALSFPEYTSWSNKVRERLVDLLIPFRRFHYYHPLQKGSASIKSVLPALTGKSYYGMDIADGESASIAFQAVTYGDVPVEGRNKIRADLAKYCKLDTEGMIWIVDELKELCD